MKLSKVYALRELNFHLLPDLMVRVMSSVPSPMLVEEDGTELVLGQWYEVRTLSQVASTRNPQEFRDILRTLDDPPVALTAGVECFHKAKHLRTIQREPTALSFRYGSESIPLSMARNTADSMKTLFRAFEETFSLATVKPPVQQEEEG